MAGATLYFEDFRVGDELLLGPVAVTAEDIIAFAEQWDPQPMHLDAEAAGETLLGELTASGWHVCCLLMRMMCDGYLCKAASMGAPGIEEVRWIKPVRPGDELTARGTVETSRVLGSRPEIGAVNFHYAIANQRGEIVTTAAFTGFFRRREAEAAP